MVAWKLPRLIWRRGSWLLFMVTVDALTQALQGFRYQLLTKSLAFLAVFFVLVTDRWYVVGVAGAVLASHLVVSLSPTIVGSFRPTSFLTRQTSTV